MRFACVLLFILAGAVATAADDSDDCEGRNPLHCGTAATAEEGGVITLPPGGCEGRNPRFCQETAPEVIDPPAAPKRRQRADRPSDNPNRNPNRRRAGDAGAGGGSAGGASGGASGGSGGSGGS